MDCNDHLSMAGSGTGTILLSTSILGGENSPPAQADANDPGLERTNLFGEARTCMPKKHWLWIILAIVAAFFAWKYFFASSATA